MQKSKWFKSLTVIALVLIFMLSAAAAVSAVPEGPAPLRVYVILIESNSDVYTPDPSEARVVEGDTYTFRLPDDLPDTLTNEEVGEYTVEFSNWRFIGEYDVVSGSVDENGESFDKEVVLKPKSDIEAVACFIEDNAAFHLVDVDTNSSAFKPLIEEGECIKGDTFTFTVPASLDGFICWEFDGKYEVVRGKVDDEGVSFDREVVLKPLSGIDAFARFEEESDEDEATPDEVLPDSAKHLAPTGDEGIENDSEKDSGAEGRGNESKRSPMTGDRIPAIFLMFISSLAGIMLAVKKIKE